MLIGAMILGFDANSLTERYYKYCLSNFYLGLDEPEIWGVWVSLIGIRNGRGIAKDIL